VTPRFRDKVVVVTGAARGLGRAAAVRFAQEGARVVLVDLADLEESREAVAAADAPVVAVTADVTRACDAERMVAEAVRAFGGVDCLINNAGIEGAVAPLVEYPEAVFDRVMAVNVKGVWLGIKAVAPAMRARGGGAIVNVSSISGLRASPGMVAYGASKHAVNGLTRTAAVELAPDGIRVNAICPAPMDTAMRRAIEHARSPADPDAARRAALARTPLGRYGEPEEVAALIAFLCSADAAYVTGVAYTIDGGRTA
jgi:NAD(P)-dependent dehydrogenase (short-subunit alcohol dehydrogenase family)